MCIGVNEFLHNFFSAPLSCKLFFPADANLLWDNLKSMRRFCAARSRTVNRDFYYLWIFSQLSMNFFFITCRSDFSAEFSAFPRTNWTVKRRLDQCTRDPFTRTGTGWKMVKWRKVFFIGVDGFVHEIFRFLANSRQPSEAKLTRLNSCVLSFHIQIVLRRPRCIFEAKNRDGNFFQRGVAPFKGWKIAPIRKKKSSLRFGNFSSP